MSIRNVTHHRFSQDEIREAGFDTDFLVKNRFEASKGEVEPRTWNTKVNDWGHTWSIVDYVDGRYEVMIGLCGCMQGITVGRFQQREHAEHFEEDFRTHKVFALQGNEEWKAYVREAHARRAFDTSRFQSLIALGREEGIRADGFVVKKADLQAIFDAGLRVWKADRK